MLKQQQNNDNNLTFDSGASISIDTVDVEKDDDNDDLFQLIDENISLNAAYQVEEYDRNNKRKSDDVGYDADNEVSGSNRTKRMMAGLKEEKDDSE